MLTILTHILTAVFFFWCCSFGWIARSITWPLFKV